jgi:hypothetical protein
VKLPCSKIQVSCSTTLLSTIPCFQNAGGKPSILVLDPKSFPDSLFPNTLSPNPDIVPSTSVLIRGCTFMNNTFDRSAVDVFGRGYLEVVDSCFMNTKYTQDPPDYYWNAQDARELLGTPDAGVLIYERTVEGQSHRLGSDVYQIPPAGDNPVSCAMFSSPLSSSPEDTNLTYSCKTVRVPNGFDLLPPACTRGR